MLASTHQDIVCENTLKQDVETDEINNFSQEEVLAEGKCGEWHSLISPTHSTIISPQKSANKRSYINTSQSAILRKNKSSTPSLGLVPNSKKEQHAIHTALNLPRFFITNLHNQNDDSETVPLTYAEIIAKNHILCKKLLHVQFEGANVLFRCGTWLGKDHQFAICAECDRVSRFHFDSWLWKQGLNQVKLKIFMKLCPKLKNVKLPEQAARLIWKSPNDYIRFYPVEKYKKDKFTQEPWEREENYYNST